ncbi:MAG: oxygen-independent coproporphyrinogen III oxidase [Planctomycetota bacterium]|jgi:oxygen-independent coproporphyrinogen-3 oxidase|nr:oxygen-independent coproporphyrinogen III oxidase [Planctomycetota bacterium]
MTQRPVARATTAELLARFDRPGPRYTSYPTAVEFDEAVGARTYEEHLALADAAGDEPLSLYVHLPFCESRCLFCGCHVIITPHKERAAPYLELLEREIELVAERLPHRRRCSQLHLGGGTPTYHAPEELDRLLGFLLGTFEPVADAELAVEVDPRVTTPEHLALLAAHGFSRLSLGVQDFDPTVQEAIGRVQSVELTREVVETARAEGFGGVNLDLIYGLPHQGATTFEETVERTLELAPDRVALYSFAFVPWIRGHMQRLSEDDFPAREEKLALFALARERFLAAGYEPIGMDHFARPDDELARARREGRLRRNFQGYTIIPAEDVVGLGISAIGDVRGAWVQNHKKLSTYRDAVEAGRLPTSRGIVRSADDELRRALIQELMCHFRVDVERFERSAGIVFREVFEEDLLRVDALVADGLATFDGRWLAATPTGELFVRNLAMCFDRYWREKHEGGERPVFSRTV